MNRDVFFAHARQELFSGALTAPQVAGIDLILDYWEQTNPIDPYGPVMVDRIANILAQTYHETGKRMEPVREAFALTDAEAIRKLSKRYPYAKKDPETGFAYFGRGFIQITHRDNYRRVGDYLGLPLEMAPDLALEPHNAVRILVDGMSYGWFTGKSLEDYFNVGRNDPVSARRIVNGTDQAHQIAGYHGAFLSALTAAQDPEMPEPEHVERPSPAPVYVPPLKDKTQSVTIRTAGAGLGIGTVTAGAQAVRAVDPKGGIAETIASNPWLVALGIVALMAVIGVLVWRYLIHRKYMQGP